MWLAILQRTRSNNEVLAVPCADILGHWLLPPGLSVCTHPLGLILGKPILPPSLLLVVVTLPPVQVKMTSYHPYRASSVPGTVVSSHSILAF